MKYPTKMRHPGQDIIQEIKARGWTQKHFSLLLGKKVSEVNELIKGKRNITIQRDLLLSKVLGSPEKFRMNKQIDYDYIIVKQNFIDSKADKIIQKYAKIETQAPKAKDQIDVSKSNTKAGKHKKHEGIFRNF